MRENWEAVERKVHLGTYCQRAREVIEVEIIEMLNLTWNFIKILENVKSLKLSGLDAY